MIFNHNNRVREVDSSHHSTTSSIGDSKKSHLSHKKNLEFSKKKNSNRGRNACRSEMYHGIREKKTEIINGKRKTIMSCRQAYGYDKHHFEQQDSILTTKINPNITRHRLHEILKHTVTTHNECTYGTTVSNIAFIPNSNDPSQSRIITSHLGDSRSTAIVELDNGDIFSISLTQDHDLDNPKVKASIEAKDSDFEIFHPQRGKTQVKIKSSTINRLKESREIRDKEHLKKVEAKRMTVGGTVGDNFKKKVGINEELKGFPYKTPETQEINISQIQSFFKQNIKNLSIINACDGLYDSFQNDYELIINEAEGSFSMQKAKAENKEKLSSVVKKYQSRYNLGERLYKYFFGDDLPNYLCHKAYDSINHPSYDNISIFHAKLIDQGQLCQDQAFISMIADGHGGQERSVVFDESRGINLPHIEDNPYQSSTGAFVSAHVISDLFQNITSLYQIKDPFFDEFKIYGYIQQYLVEYVKDLDLEAVKVEYENPRNSIREAAISSLTRQSTKGINESIRGLK